jgi:hypothetical protein
VIVPQLSISPRGAARCLIYKYRLAMFVEREDFAHLIVESPGGATPMACEQHLMRELGSKDPPRWWVAEIAAKRLNGRYWGKTVARS